jgi:hypothetical protein
MRLGTGYRNFKSTSSTYGDFHQGHNPARWHPSTTITSDFIADLAGVSNEKVYAVTLRVSAAGQIVFAINQNCIFISRVLKRPRHQAAVGCDHGLLKSESHQASCRAKERPR